MDRFAFEEDLEGRKQYELRVPPISLFESRRHVKAIRFETSDVAYHDIL